MDLQESPGGKVAANFGNQISHFSPPRMAGRGLANDVGIMATSAG